MHTTKLSLSVTYLLNFEATYYQNELRSSARGQSVRNFPSKTNDLTMSTPSHHLPSNFAKDSELRATRVFKNRLNSSSLFFSYSCFHFKIVCDSCELNDSALCELLFLTAFRIQGKSPISFLP